MALKLITNIRRSIRSEVNAFGGPQVLAPLRKQVGLLLMLGGVLQPGSVLALSGTTTQPAEAGTAPAPRWHMETKPGRRIEVVTTSTTSSAGFRANKWTTVVAIPPELPSQRDVSTEVKPDGKILRETSPHKREFVWVESHPKTSEEKKRFRFTVTYRATLQQRKLVAVPEGAIPNEPEPLTPEEKKIYLLPTEFYDFNEREFQRWLNKTDLHQKDNESAVDFAKRVFLLLYNDFKYDAEGASDRASVVCRTGKSHCGGLSSIFVATMRANGIPARWLLGCWADGGSHVMAEFFAEGIGWIPADPSNSIFHFPGNAETALEKGFGVSDGNFFTTQVDHGWEYESDMTGKLAMPWPYGAMGEGKGNTSKWRTEGSWDVRDLATD